MRKIPVRQIHLDFHTSPDIPDIGADFDIDEFTNTLSSAKVEAINLFAKCHHGWFYYPTKIGKEHPHLKTNLLQGQIDACNKAGIKYGIYTCVGWNENTANEHPEWLVINPDGLSGGKAPFERNYYKWQKLCLNNVEYRDLIKSELSEMLDFFEPYSFWIDIILQDECVCRSCKEKIKKAGMQISIKEDRMKFARLSQIDYQRDIFDHIRTVSDKVEIYFNGHSYGMDSADIYTLANKRKQAYNSFMDIESLPSPEWGYSHFPAAVNYMNINDTHDITMMNGKFHMSWGDFGSLRNLAALKYECYRALANGAGICIGDQLHPLGVLDTTVYKRIGEVFSEIAKRQEYCMDTTKRPQVGVYAPNGSISVQMNDNDNTVEGVYRVLSELLIQFDFIDCEVELNKYELVILPDAAKLNESAILRIENYIQKGGKVIVSGRVYINNEPASPDFLPVKYLGEADYCPRYIEFEEDNFANLPPMKYVCYENGAKVSAKDDTEIIAYTVNPYFNRSEEHFCSHRQTPPMMKVSNEPAIIKNGNVLYISNPLFTDYAVNGVMAYRDILSAMIFSLIDKPFVKSDLPVTAEVTIRQSNSNGNKTLILHVLNFIIQRKCRMLDTIEAVIPLFDRKFHIYTEAKPKEIIRIPSMKNQEFTFENGYTSFTIDRIDDYELMKIIL